MVIYNGNEGGGVLRGRTPEEYANMRCETLAAISEAVTLPVETEDVLSAIADVTMRRFTCDAVFLHRFVTGDRFVYSRYKGDIDIQHEPSSFDINMGRVSRLVKDRKPVFMDFEHPHPDDIMLDAAKEYGFLNAISIPLFCKDEMLGVLTLEYKQRTSWGEGDAEFLTQLGRVIGSLITRVQHSKKESELQVLKERARLSSEIHDFMAQPVSLILMTADTALELYDRGEDELVKQRLLDLSDTARDLNSSLRIEMLSLKALSKEHQGLVKSISEYLERVEVQWGLKTEFEMMGVLDEDVPLYASLQLVRILSESITNVIRHAHATSIYVFLQSTPYQIVMSVVDDGIGFDIESVSSDHLGIQIMRERAAIAGGTLKIISDETGTTVRVEVQRK